MTSVINKIRNIHGERKEWVDVRDAVMTPFREQKQYIKAAYTHGEMAEWSNAADSKSVDGVSPSEGSNPSLSASILSDTNGFKLKRVRNRRVRALLNSGRFQTSKMKNPSN